MAGQLVVRCSKPSVAMVELRWSVYMKCSIALNTGASMSLMRVGVAAAVLRGCAIGPRSSALSTDERAASTDLCALMFLGSVSNYCINNVVCPVVVIKGT
uniref:Uncharacterized protein n=1 Tax=Oryza nivara TaxID=4536 RepID=A0A0E0GD97_ORYNI